MRIEPEMIERLLHRQFAELGERKPWVKGLPASPGAATGLIVFSELMMLSVGRKRVKR